LPLELPKSAHSLSLSLGRLAGSTSENFKAYGSYKLGICYWVTGQKDKIAPVRAQH